MMALRVRDISGITMIERSHGQHRIVGTCFFAGIAVRQSGDGALRISKFDGANMVGQSLLQPRNLSVQRRTKRNRPGFGLR